MTHLQYEIRPRADHRGVDLISGKLPFGKLWYAEPNAVENADSYARFNAGSQPATITTFDESGAVIERRDFNPEQRPRGNTLGAL